LDLSATKQTQTVANNADSPADSSSLNIFFHRPRTGKLILTVDNAPPHSLEDRIARSAKFFCGLVKHSLKNSKQENFKDNYSNFPHDNDFLIWSATQFDLDFSSDKDLTEIRDFDLGQITDF
jgi:hypothetical protein